MDTQEAKEDIRRMTPVAAPPEELEGVSKVYQLLEEVESTHSERPPVFTLTGPTGKSVEIPESVFYVLERVAEVLARGDALTVVPVGKEMTTQQAADLLNVSRQYLVRLLNENKLSHSKVGKHRRLKIEDVLEFKEQRDRERMKSLDDLAQLTESLGGYGDVE